MFTQTQTQTRPWLTATTQKVFSRSGDKVRKLKTVDRLLVVDVFVVVLVQSDRQCYANVVA